MITSAYDFYIKTSTSGTALMTNGIDCFKLIIINVITPVNKFPSESAPTSFPRWYCTSFCKCIVLIKVCKFVLRYNLTKASNVKDLQNSLVYQQVFKMYFLEFIWNVTRNVSCFLKISYIIWKVLQHRLSFRTAITSVTKPFCQWNRWRI